MDTPGKETNAAVTGVCVVINYAPFGHASNPLDLSLTFSAPVDQFFMHTRVHTTPSHHCFGPTTGKYQAVASEKELLTSLFSAPSGATPHPPPPPSPSPAVASSTGAGEEADGGLGEDVSGDVGGDAVGDEVKSIGEMLAHVTEGLARPLKVGHHFKYTQLCASFVLLWVTTISSTLPPTPTPNPILTSFPPLCLQVRLEGVLEAQLREGSGGMSLSMAMVHTYRLYNLLAFYFVVVKRIMVVPTSEGGREAGATPSALVAVLGECRATAVSVGQQI